jgi:hypothetical protein
VLMVFACGREPASHENATSKAPAAAWFADRANELGVDFIHFNGMSGELYYPEIMGPGVGLLDYDNDGDLDIYVVQGQMLGDGKTLKDATFPPQGPLRDRLFRNDLSGTHRFTDVTEQSGIDVHTYGMGVAVGDIDNDGFPDIYRTGVGGAVMLHNNGNGTFSDVTARSGTGDRGGWSVSAAFVDIDRDGWLDLFVGTYLTYSLNTVRQTATAHSRAVYFAIAAVAHSKM